jgi:hypothetical protein
MAGGLLSLSGGGKRPPKPTAKTIAGVASKKIALPKGALGQTWLRTGLTAMREDKRTMWGDIRTTWRPSSMGEQCDRKSILSMYGYRGDPISHKLGRIFSMGNAVEDIWRADFQKMGVLVQANVRIQDPGPPAISGECDAILQHLYEPGRKLIAEIKSINCNGFKQLPPLTLDPEMNFQGLMNIGGSLNGRVRGYMIQLQNYMRLFKIHEGMLLFDCKCNSDYNDYGLVYHPELVEVNQNRLVRLDDYRGKLMVPPCTCAGKHDGLCIYRPEDTVSLEEMKIFTEDII